MAKKKATKKKATKKTAKKTTKKAKEMILVGSKTKDALKSSGLNVSAGTLEALNDKVYELIAAAQDRCANNGRKTLRGYDI